MEDVFGVKPTGQGSLARGHIYMWNIVWNIKFINVVFEKNKILIPRNHIYIYEEHRVEHRFFKKPETFIILEASGLPKAETFTILHSPMFAKCLQKSSKHVQPRNSSVEHLWNIKKCSFEGFRSPGGCCLKACGCHVGGWFVWLLQSISGRRGVA